MKKEAITLESLKALAKSRGGECLSTEYVNAHAKMKWRCAHGHEWVTTANSIRRGSWCQKDDYADRTTRSRKYSLQFFQDLAIKRGGSCLDDQYEPSKPLNFVCSSGHQFERSRNELLQRFRWCPYCQSNRMEELCRTIYQRGFSQAFPRCNPTFMRHGGRRLQLDGYCPELKLAFEYQGRQHDSLDSFYSGGAEGLAHRKTLDASKLELCKAAEVVLIQIPTIPANYNLDQIINWVVSTIPIEYQDQFDRARINHANFDSTIFDPVKQQVLSLISERKGTLLSLAVPSMTTRIEVECDKGHLFNTTGHRISQGKWCIHCAPNKKIPEEEMRQLIESKGGTLIERFVKGRSTKIRVKCSQGHIWAPSQSSLRAGNWCRACHFDMSGRRVEDARKLALAKNGRVISDSCSGTQVFLVWECSQKHRFKATLDSVKHRKYWCPKCQGSSRRMNMMLNGPEE